MQTSADRILTTHTGSLPRPATIRDRVVAGTPRRWAAAEQEALATAVRDVVQRQVGVGIDVVSDGELSKPSYATYVADRLTGFERRGEPMTASDLEEHPAYAQRLFSDPAVAGVLEGRSCTSTVRYRDPSALERDLSNLSRAVEQFCPTEAFVTAASPGLISVFFPNAHYTTDAGYIFALAEAMRAEYHAIVNAGFVLQLDAPDLAMGRHTRFASLGLDAFRERAELHVRALNEAVADIDPNKMRLHACWGNYGGPHHHDVELAEVVDILLQARPAALSFVAANPRHEHEWRVWQQVELPPGKILIPGVIDSTTNIVEHPELVAERILRFAHIVGPERIIAGTDCGFGTFAGLETVVPSVAWAKLGALVQGARLASTRL